MRKTIRAILAIFLLMGAGLSAQSAAVGVLNQSGGTAYLLTLPVDDLEYVALVSDSELLKGSILQYADRIQSVPDGGLYDRLPVYRQDTAVIGYVYRGGTLEHPLFAFRIPAGTTSGFFAVSPEVYLEGELDSAVFNVLSDRLPPATAITIDGSMLDWLGESELIRFSPNQRPRRTLRTSEGRTEEPGPDDLLFARRAGTDPDRLSMVIEPGQLAVMLTSYSPMTLGTSYLLRFFAGEERSNRYTLEIPIDGTTGHVLLWSEGDQPSIVGNFKRTEFFLECSVERRYLPLEIQQALEGLIEGTLVFSSGFSDREIFEEYIWANIPIQSIERISN